MISMTESMEKELLSLLKRENRAGLRIVVGPDERLRLELDKGSAVGGHTDFINTGIVIRDEADDVMIDIPG